MHPKNHKTIYCVILMFSMVLAAVPGICFSENHFKTAVVVSKKIKPYIHVVDGITEEMAVTQTQMDVFFLSFPNNKPDPQLDNQIIRQLAEGQYDLVTAVGPEAAVLVWGDRSPFKKLYAGVLDPLALPQLLPEACGISLRIPVSLQLEKIAKTFPIIKKIGVLFDPRHNQWFYDQALARGKEYGLEMIALTVNSKHEIANVLKEHKGAIDAVWMIPDQTVISEKIIHYVIKQGIYNHMGVIGYNSFFSRSGAVFSFEFDYKALGSQAGQTMTAYLETGVCRQEAPAFNTIVNQKIADKIGIRVAK